MRTTSKNTSRGRARCLPPAFSLWFFDAGCLHKEGNWVTMNEQCSWCSREGGLGNSSRSRSPDLAGIGGGLKPSSVPGFGKIQDHKNNFFFWARCLPKYSPKDQSSLASLINWKKINWWMGFKVGQRTGEENTCIKSKPFSFRTKFTNLKFMMRIASGSKPFFWVVDKINK